MNSPEMIKTNEYVNASIKSLDMLALPKIEAYDASISNRRCLHVGKE